VDEREWIPTYIATEIDAIDDRLRVKVLAVPGLNHPGPPHPV
jgi:hypothetical protein